MSFLLKGLIHKQNKDTLFQQTPFPQQWHDTNKSGDAAVYGYIWSTFSPGFVDVKFLWDFLSIEITCNFAWGSIAVPCLVVFDSNLFVSVKSFKRYSALLLISVWKLLFLYLFYKNLMQPCAPTVAGTKYRNHSVFSFLINIFNRCSFK